MLRIGETVSDCRVTICDVLQGTILEPTLFPVYNNDLFGIKMDRKLNHYAVYCTLQKIEVKFS